MVRQALEAAVDRLRTDESATVPTDDLDTTPGQRRADALGLVAESALAAALDPGRAGDRYQVVLHVDGPGLGIVSQADAHADDAGQAVLEETGTRVSAETSLRLACDASLVVIRHRADGSTLDVGRKTRTIPPAIRRALAARDPHCRFPGCTTRTGDAHHITHWAHGGATRLDNLVRLCRRHHRAVHEEGWTLERDEAGEVIVRRPDGSLLPPVPTVLSKGALGDPLDRSDRTLRAAGVMIGPPAATPVWHGERLNIGWAVDVLRDQPAGSASSGR